jgi:hypothetical protein
MAKGFIAGDQFEEAFVGTRSTKDNITAAAGGGQANATKLVTQINRVVTVASGNDSVVLPAVSVVPTGTEVTISNAHATNSLNVYPAGTDAIDALGASNPRAIAAGKTATFTTISPGVWHSMIGA